MWFAFAIEHEKVFVPRAFQNDVARVNVHPIAKILGPVFDRIGAASAAVLTVWNRV